MLVVNTKLVPKDERPRSIEDLADPKWRGKVGMAKPLFGATATHAAALFAFWGAEKAEDYYRRLKQNQIVIESGNKQVAVDVAAGRLAFGVTDTDDALEEFEHGQPVEIVYPDQQPGGIGTFFFPNTLAVIKGGPHPDAARRLIDFLLSPDVEGELAGRPQRADSAELRHEGQSAGRNAAHDPRDESRFRRRCRFVGRSCEIPPRQFHGRGLAAAAGSRFFSFAIFQLCGCQNATARRSGLTLARCPACQA